MNFSKISATHIQINKSIKNMNKMQKTGDIFE